MSKNTSSYIEKYGDIKIKFGKYKNNYLKHLPDNYLKWCIGSASLKGKALLYAKYKLNMPKDLYKVIIEDSVRTDGTYIIEGYSKNDAMINCVKKYNIKSSQSYCGTTFKIEKYEENNGQS